MTSEGFREMFEGDCAVTLTGKFLSGGSRACRPGSGNLFIKRIFLCDSIIQVIQQKEKVLDAFPVIQIVEKLTVQSQYIMPTITITLVGLLRQILRCMN